ncbi:unnamed protein product [Mytilus edulis]|uniref:TTF-type domain-containing protein n=1 Tax=Mytilus edulis TaxID=6550 RepID=A0A8S3STF8_MYTED|nr:unnamed protein product [Mytilus edulis]
MEKVTEIGLSFDPFVIKKQSFSENEKLKILSTPSSSDVKTFPTTKGRKYSKDWEKTYPWLRYSVEEDAAYCAYCLVFGDGHGDGLFGMIGFRDWKNASGDKRGSLRIHENSKLHSAAKEKADNLIMVSNESKPDICSSISKAYENKIVRNRQILLAIIDVIVSLGQRNIALRETGIRKLKKEDGNFQYFVEWVAKFDEILRHHLQSQGPHYLSPKVQNELIYCCETEIREKIVNDCKQAEFYSICADETTDVSVKEQLSLCIRYVDRIKSEVREEFMGFVEPDKTDAENIAGNILTYLDKWGLEIEKLRGQGYDGASVMSGHVNGVQTRIRRTSPRAYYVHCRSHNLNLVVTQSCKVVHPIRNIMDNVVQLTWFICASANRKNILKEEMFTESDLMDKIMEINEEDDSSGKLLQEAMHKKSIQPLSETRWTARVDALSAIITNYEKLHNAVNKIEEKSSGDSKSKAGGHRRLMEDPEFIMALVVAQYVLAFLKPLTLSLQKVDCDMVVAFDEARNLLRTLKSIRSEEAFSKLFERARVLADVVEIILQPRRRVGRQIHRDNPNVDSAEQLWRVSIFYAFLDHVCTELERRFPQEQRQLMMGQYLLPGKFDYLTDECIDEIKEAYNPDLPDIENWQQEILRWKTKFADKESVPNSLQQALVYAHQDFYPNIRRVLVLLLTLPSPQNENMTVLTEKLLV